MRQQPWLYGLTHLLPVGGILAGLGLFIVPAVLYAQTLGIGGGLGMGSHPSSEGDKSPTVPQLGTFYRDNLLLFGQAEIVFSSAPVTPMAGFIIEHQTLDSGFPPGSLILGDKLSITSYGLLGGVGYRIAPPMLLYGYACYLLKDYEGTGQLDASTVLRSTFEMGEFVRLGVGVNMCDQDFPIGLVFRLGYDFGTVKRGDIEATVNGKTVERLVPDGDLSLPDNQFSLNVGLLYFLEL